MKKKKKKHLLAIQFDKFLMTDPWMIASNARSLPKELKKLTKHKDEFVRQAIATNPAATEDILLLLIHDSDRKTKFDAGTRLMGKVTKSGLLLSDKNLMDVICIFHSENFEAMAKFNEIRKKKKAKK